MMKCVSFATTLLLNIVSEVGRWLKYNKQRYVNEKYIVLKYYKRYK